MYERSNTVHLAAIYAFFSFFLRSLLWALQTPPASGVSARTLVLRAGYRFCSRQFSYSNFRAFHDRFSEVASVSAVFPRSCQFRPFSEFVAVSTVFRGRVSFGRFSEVASVSAVSPRSRQFRPFFRGRGSFGCFPRSCQFRPFFRGRVSFGRFSEVVAVSAVFRVLPAFLLVFRHRIRPPAITAVFPSFACFPAGFPSSHPPSSDYGGFSEFCLLSCLFSCWFPVIAPVFQSFADHKHRLHQFRVH